ncbi:hypothetical protein VTI74DRAFT_4741 [Chaetomium olivicolor]
MLKAPAVRQHFPGAHLPLSLHPNRPLSDTINNNVTPNNIHHLQQATVGHRRTSGLFTASCPFTAPNNTSSPVANSRSGPDPRVNEGSPSNFVSSHADVADFLPPPPPSRPLFFSNPASRNTTSPAALLSSFLDCEQKEGPQPTNFCSTSDSARALPPFSRSTLRGFLRLLPAFPSTYQPPSVISRFFTVFFAAFFSPKISKCPPSSQPRRPGRGAPRRRLRRSLWPRRPPGWRRLRRQQ